MQSMVLLVAVVATFTLMACAPADPGDRNTPTVEQAAAADEVQAPASAAPIIPEDFTLDDQFGCEPQALLHPAPDLRIVIPHAELDEPISSAEELTPMFARDMYWGMLQEMLSLSSSVKDVDTARQAVSQWQVSNRRANTLISRVEDMPQDLRLQFNQTVFKDENFRDLGNQIDGELGRLYSDRDIAEVMFPFHTGFDKLFRPLLEERFDIELISVMEGDFQSQEIYTESRVLVEIEYFVDPEELGAEWEPDFECGLIDVMQALGPEASVVYPYEWTTRLEFSGEIAGVQIDKGMLDISYFMVPVIIIKLEIE